MNLKNITKNLQKLLLGAGVVLAAVFASCSDDKEQDTNKPYDPSQPVVISDFMPRTGGYQEQIIVYGSNFGNDKNRVKLTIGGKEAVVVSVMNDKMYAYIPASAYGSEIEVTILDENGNELGSGITNSDLTFEYTKKVVVGTLCGYKNEQDNQGEMFGPFDLPTCGFRHEGTLAFDPLFKNRLYLTYDGGHYIVQLDLESRTHTRLMSSSKFQDRRLRNADFTLDGEYMIVSTDRDENGRHSTSLWIVKRSGDGTFSDKSSVSMLAAYRQCNGVAVHPVNGEVYFNSYENGQLFRLDLKNYFATINGEVEDPSTGMPKTWTGYQEDGCFDELFQIMDPSYEFNITIHPTGNYAYLNIINKHYILRTDYDWKKKCFTTPYLVAGKNGSAAWEDAVGGDARVNRPYQGIFVKNPEYAGRTDEYDYYFADCNNFCIRYITPDGLVRTYAGHSPSTDNNVWGTEDGDLRTQARFRDVTGLAYDVDRDIFYVQDHNNRRIRTIGLEGEDNPANPDTPEVPGEDEGEGNGEGTENQE